MTVENALYTRLKDHSGLSALVGTRITPLQLPQRPVLPAVTYRRVSTVREHAMGADPGLARARFQVSGWAKTFDGARDVGEQIRDALQRWNGTVEGVVVQNSDILNETDLFESDVKVYQRALDFEIAYEE